MSFKDMKSASGSASLSSLSSQLEKLNKPAGGRSDDDGLWKPTVDKAGNGYAVIRFLPAPPNEELPFVRVWSHAFQSQGGWYIENSLTTIGQPDPVSELNTKLWNSGNESDKDIVRKQKRKLSYYSNILVVRDPAAPENEGKVMTFKYGQRIFDKINTAMNPKFEDEQPMNPFDMWGGADFKVKIAKVAGYRNYDSSEFSAPAPISESDEVLEDIWNQEQSLQQYVDPTKFKSYEELKARLSRVLGEAQQASPVPVAQAAPMPTAAAPAPSPAVEAPTQAAASWGDESDDDIDFFKKLSESLD